MLVFLFGLAATAYLINRLDGNALKIERDKKTAAALAEAKAALIGYAFSYNDTHPDQGYGYLPCPDTQAVDVTYGEGGELVCGALGVSILGRFPWKVMDIPPITDGDGECLWYAVSGSYKNNPKNITLNRNTQGQLTIRASDGVSYLAGPADPAVAVIFAPGKLLAGQHRDADANAVNCGGNYDATHYLDQDGTAHIANYAILSTANAISTFVAANNSNSFNDRMVFITRSQVMVNYCKSNANRLLIRVNGMTNNCGADIVELAKCTTASQNLVDYCAPPTCQAAAQLFISPTCNMNLNDPNCQSALVELKGCHG